MKLFRKPLCWILTLCAALALPVCAAEPSFSDVPAEHWAYLEIQRAAADGVVRGYADGAFQPAAELTLAHFTAILVRAFYPEDLTAAEQLVSEPWYAAAKLAADAHDLFWGVDTDITEPLSRYGMACMVFNLLYERNCFPSSEGLRDAAASILDSAAFPNENVQTAVYFVYAHGILGGYADGCFHGERTLNRAQAAAVYCRMKDTLKQWSVELVRQPAEPEAVVPPPAEPETEPPDETPDGTADFPQEVLRLVNAERAEAGAKPLTLSAELCEAAQIRAEELPDLFSHTRPDGSSCFTVLEENDIAFLTCGENIAAGQDTPEAVMSSWMNSEGHRNNILSSRYGQIGVGVIRSPDGYRIYWVQIFTD